MRLLILLKALATNVTVVGSWEHNIMPQILPEPYLDRALGGTHCTTEIVKTITI